MKAQQPVLAGMFDVPVVADQIVVNAARDQAIAEVAAHAEERTPGFADDAAAFVLAYLKQHGPTAGERLSLACKQAGIVPHDDRAFGAVYLRLVRQSCIQRVGEARRERGHGTSGGNVWALLTCAHGEPSNGGKAPGWTGPHHCAGCAEAVLAASRRFRAAVARGEYDAEGYTPAERRAQARKATS
jgi:hypothetical protein